MNEYPPPKEPTNILSDKKEEYQIGAVWYSQIPLYILLDPDLTKADLCVYGALDFIAGKRGHHYNDQGTILDALEDKLSGAHQLPDVAKLSLASIHRAIKKLRQKDYIRTEPMGLRMNHILRYYVMARDPENPPTRSSQKRN